MRLASSLLAAVTMLAVAGSLPSSSISRVSACQRGSSAPVPSSPASIKEGMRTYAVWCRSCHGLRGRGDGTTAPPGAKPANLVDAEWKHGSTNAEIFKNIKEGIAPFEFMKPQKDNLTDTDIWNIINYLRSLGPEAKK